MIDRRVVEEAATKYEEYLVAKELKDARKAGFSDALCIIGLWILGLGFAWMLIDLATWFFQAD